jgi:hypothetical protein
LNRAIADATTYKNNWRRSYHKVQSLWLTPDEMDPEKVGEVMVRLMYESGTHRRADIEVHASRYGVAFVILRSTTMSFRLPSLPMKMG